ncbi:MAG: ATP12 family chaperone protein [Allorhizobium sp.]
MREILNDDFTGPEEADPVRRAQIQMKKHLPKRFYETVGVSSDDSGHAILLDGKPVRTPGRNSLAVPSAELASQIAGEWQAQEKLIDPATMPLTRLVNTAIDAVATQTQDVFEDIVRYAGNDLMFYRADAPQELVARQAEHWDPVIAWAASDLGARFVLTQGVIHVAQPPAAIEAYAAALRRYPTHFELACLHVMTTLTGSALLPLALAEGRLTLEQAWTLAHIDEDWTAEHWGTDAEAVSRNAKRFEDMQAAATVFNTTRRRD